MSKLTKSTSLIRDVFIQNQNHKIWTVRRKVAESDAKWEKRKARRDRSMKRKNKWIGTVRNRRSSAVLMYKRVCCARIWSAIIMLFFVQSIRNEQTKSTGSRSYVLCDQFRCACLRWSVEFCAYFSFGILFSFSFAVVFISINTFWLHRGSSNVHMHSCKLRHDVTATAAASYWNRIVTIFHVEIIDGRFFFLLSFQNRERVQWVLFVVVVVVHKTERLIVSNTTRQSQ